MKLEVKMQKIPGQKKLVKVTTATLGEFRIRNVVKCNSRGRSYLTSSLPRDFYRDVRQLPRIFEKAFK